MNQEQLIKKRMVHAIIAFVIALIGLLIFIGLYIDETRRVQETYRKQYKVELGHVSENISSYLESEGDKELRYTVITCNMNSANSFAFLIDDFTEEQKTINEITTCLIKYPEQMSGKLEELRTAVDEICSDLDSGYEKADEIVASIYLKGN